MPKERITAEIKNILDSDCGFDIYIAMKDEDTLIKRFVLDEGSPTEANGFKARIRNSIETTIQNRFLSEDSQYSDGDNLADEQNRFYVMKQNDDYQPFQYLKIPDEQITSFRLEDKNNADALLFKYIIQRNGEAKTLWAYQKIQPASIPNKKKNYYQLIPKSQEQPDVFREMKEQMFMITQAVDVLILGDEIITDKIKLMERHFGLETFVRASAKRAAETITTVGLIGNNDKLMDYVQRPNKKYARKMMQIHRFPVAAMSKEGLLEKLHTVERWKNVFEIQQNQVYLRNFTDVEQVIDLFTERYTRSDVTGQEYDTFVKDKAEPVPEIGIQEQEN